MSKKTPLDMSSLLAAKGKGTSSNDAPTRPVIMDTRQDETTNRRIKDIKSRKTPSSEFVNLGFKVPKEFRHRLRIIAAAQDISLVEVLREAVDLYDKNNS